MNYVLYQLLSRLITIEEARAKTVGWQQATFAGEFRHLRDQLDDVSSISEILGKDTQGPSGNIITMTRSAGDLRAAPGQRIGALEEGTYDCYVIPVSDLDG
jgi:hypothetical protein